MIFIIITKKFELKIFCDCNDLGENFRHSKAYYISTFEPKKYRNGYQYNAVNLSLALLTISIKNAKAKKLFIIHNISEHYQI